jgi:hypothetical protein
MADERTKQKEAIVDWLRRHPRVDHQQMASGDEQIAVLKKTLPFFVPFEASAYHGYLPILDWDHKLPSQVAILRLYAFYSEMTYRAGQAEYDARLQQIKEQDKYPEFDVPDFVGLTADEAYEADVEPDGQVQQVRLVSAWRRNISHSDSKAAVLVARKSEEFQEVLSHSRHRPDYLGDLEAVSWTPPCESNHPYWTIDVWYLTDLDAAMGKGRSFLVDLKSKQIVGVREFVVRPG